MPVDLPNARTVLTMTGIGVSPYSARGLTQTLEPIAQSAQVRRTINGKLVDLSLSQFRLFRSTISGDDQRPPINNGIWPGRIVTVECIAYLTGPAEDTFIRPAVAGSEVLEEGLIHYRPILTMMVTNWTTDQNEYEAAVGWSMELEEVELPAP